MKYALYCLFGLLLSLPAHAEFLLSNAIVEFTGGGDLQQDIDIISRSQEQDYIVTELYEVKHPGTTEETRTQIDDPVEAGLLVTPDKTILPGGGRQVLRLVLLRPPEAAERIFRVTVKPVINDLKASTKMGLKVLVGYEMLVIVRPATIAGNYQITRSGQQLHIVNQGNSNVLLEVGKQCPPGKTEGDSCKQTPSLRIYAGARAEATLPYNAPVTYRVWDGKDMHSHDIP